jgi:prepilin-type N-terminal cleavage/methylation domain-containing protein/prepilin-type processing-associated H-X9-DG protein
MNNKRAFTLIELLVVISVIAILLAILMPSLRMAKEAGQRIACLGNLKGFQTAWELYANANDDKIVNGEAYGGADGTNGARNLGNGLTEPYWTGDDMTDWNNFGRTHLPMQQQLDAIHSGALYSYVKSDKIYHCPTGLRNEWRNYAIVDSMNGRTQDGRNVTNPGGGSKVVGDTVLWIKRKSEIRKPPASARLVFGDEGMATADSIATYYTNEQWWDPALVRHSNGNTYSFADGHAEYWKWKGTGTITNGRAAQPVQNFKPVSEDDYRDLYRFQTAVWGRLGYTPTRSTI